MANEYKPVTAQDAIAPFGALKTDVDNAEKAKEQGVVDVAYVDYEKALVNYEGRSDIETLESRRARENGGNFAHGAGVASEPAFVASNEAKDSKETADFKAAQAKETAKVAEDTK